MGEIGPLSLPPQPNALACPPRISPLERPYPVDVATALFGIHPRDSAREPLKLFRTMVRNLPLCDPMFAFGRFMLGRNSTTVASYDERTRELVIDRVTAGCRCEYEWGVHMAAYGGRVGITPEQAYSLVHGDAEDSCWTEEDRVTLRFVDGLRADGQVSDATWTAMRARFSNETLIELLVLTGWYHAISYLASGARVELEDWAHRFPRKRQ
jgi:alkylhydroperoxidase family enzyme